MRGIAHANAGDCMMMHDWWTGGCGMGFGG